MGLIRDKTRSLCIGQHGSQEGYCRRQYSPSVLSGRNIPYSSWRGRMNSHNPSTHDKALAINLHPAQYGTFAEIGAGQEVARWFFHVGGAAATVARSISAYDMAMSTATYGPTLATSAASVYRRCWSTNFTSC